jgi:single-strand DNA-binding protein
MFHTIIACGRLTKDPVQRYTGDGKAVTDMSIAVDDGFGESKKTIWLKITVWEKTAEACANLKKGTAILVEGRLQHDSGNPRTWSKDGKTFAGFEITASNVRFLSGKGEDVQAPVEDDLPF